MSKMNILIKKTLPDTFEKGDTVFENPFFAGTYNAKDRSTISNPAYNDTAYSACLWTENVSSNDAGRPDLRVLIFYQDYCIGINTLQTHLI